MTTRSRDRVARRRLWLVVALVAAAAAAVVVVAVAVGLFGRSSVAPPAADRSPAPAAAAPSAPEPSATAKVAAAQRKVTGKPKADPRPTRPPAVTTVYPAAAPMPRSTPTRLSIPAIGVDSDLMSLGLKRDGSLETPPGAFPAGWYTGAPTPGQVGPAIVVGHVRYNTPGVFARLSELRVRDLIDVRRADGSTAVFQVSSVQHFAKSAFPTQKVYGDLDHAGLRLITCGGLDASTDEFDENVVVFADLVRR